MLGTEGKGTNITDTDIYGTLKSTAAEGSSVGDNADTTAYYYNFKIDYMISTSKKDNLKIGVENVKVYREDGNEITSPGADVATLDKATRVAFINATSYTDKDVVTYGTSGTEYAIATACTVDHNQTALGELGYTGASEYTKYDNGKSLNNNYYTFC